MKNVSQLWTYSFYAAGLALAWFYSAHTRNTQDHMTIAVTRQVAFATSLTWAEAAGGRSRRPVCGASPEVRHRRVRVGFEP